MPRGLVPVFVAAVGLTAGLAACADGDGRRDPMAFCERLRLERDALTDPRDPAALVVLYQDLDDEAPLQIKDEWSELTALMELVSTYDAADPEATQEVLKQSLRAQNSVTAVAVWVKSSCELELGPIPTSVPIGGTGDALVDDASEGSDGADGSDASGG